MFIFIYLSFFNPQMRASVARKRSIEVFHLKQHVLEIQNFRKDEKKRFLDKHCLYGTTKTYPFIKRTFIFFLFSQ